MTNIKKTIRKVSEKKSENTLTAYQISSLLLYAVDGVLDGCGNSYANSCVSSWLEHAKKAGGYHGATTGQIQELRAAHEQWVEDNCPDGLLPDWKIKAARKPKKQTI